MATRLNVKQDAAGGWVVLREGERRSAVRSSNERAAVSRAREQVRREGGGEVRVLDSVGKIARSSKVAASRRGRATRRAA